MINNEICIQTNPSPRAAHAQARLYLRLNIIVYVLSSG